MRETENLLPLPHNDADELLALSVIDTFYAERFLKKNHTASLETLKRSIDTATELLSDPDKFTLTAVTFLYSIGCFIPDYLGYVHVDDFEKKVGLYALEALARKSNVISEQITNERNRKWALRLTELFVTKAHHDSSISDKGKKILQTHLPIVQQGIRDNDFTSVCLIPVYFLHTRTQGLDAINETIDDIMRNGTNIAQIQTIISVLSGKDSPAYGFLRTVSMDKLSLLLARFGYTNQQSHDLTRAWVASYPDDPPFAQNIRALFELETEKPGCTKVLMKEFGIHCFDRYPKSILLRQLEEKNDKKNPYGLIIYPREDYNGAFYEDKKLLESLETQLKAISQNGPTYTIRIVECGSLYAVGKAIVKSAKTYGKIHFAIIGGHGSPTELELSEGENITKKIIKRGKGIQRMDRFFTPNPSILLFSCSTGRKSGLAQELSHIGNGARVIGPKSEAHPTGISVEYKENALFFSVKFHGTSPALYESGEQTHLSP